MQMSLRQGCEKILVSDSVQLADKMHRTQKRGIQCQGKKNVIQIKRRFYLHEIVT